MVLTLVLAAALQGGVAAPLTLDEKVDRITDAKSVHLTLRPRPRAFLSMGCLREGDPSTMQVVISFDATIGYKKPGYLAGGQDVEYRFDQRPARGLRWYSDIDRVYALADDPVAKPMPFVTSMRGTTSLFMRTIDSFGRSKTLDLNYPDATDVIDQLLARCGFDAEGKPLKRKR